MLYKSRAPLRIGFAGGGTDVSPYSEIYGGAVLNATISLYANVILETNDSNFVEIISEGNTETIPLKQEIEINGKSDLVKAVYNYFKKNHQVSINGLRISVHVDVPHGSGLGTSSTLVVALAGAFALLYRLELEPGEIAAMAYDIERKQLGWAGGKQDQYAASFGGFNLMLFENNQTTVISLDLNQDIVRSLEENLLLYYTGISRNSADIIRQQSKNVELKEMDSIEAMHKLKEEVYIIKLLLETGEIENFGEIMDKNFLYKKRMADGISNPYLESIYLAAIEAGATGGKISGAGGGGFVIFYCPPGKKASVENALMNFPGYIQPYHFEDKGLQTWVENS